MNYSGETVLLRWDDKLQWSKTWSVPEDKCDIHDYCGSFGICNRDNFKRCRCLPGFTSTNGFLSDGEWESQGWRGKSASCTTKDVTFLNLTNIKVGYPDQEISTQTQAESQSICINMCPES